MLRAAKDTTQLRWRRDARHLLDDVWTSIGCAGLAVLISRRLAGRCSGDRHTGGAKHHSPPDFCRVARWMD